MPDKLVKINSESPDLLGFFLVYIQNGLGKKKERKSLISSEGREVQSQNGQSGKFGNLILQKE